MARWALEVVEGDHRFGAATLADMSPELLADIRNAGRLSWVPATSVTTLTRCYAAHAGEAAVIGLWRRYTIKSTELPLFGPLFHGATRLFGIHPGAALRVLSQAWGLSARDCGSVEVEVIENRARVRMHSLPVGCRDRVMALSLHGVIEGTFATTQHTGTIVEAGDQLAPDGWYEVHASWDRNA